MRCVFALLFLVLLAGCGGAGSEGGTPQSACAQQTFEGSRFTVCDSRGDELKLFAAGPKEVPARGFADLMGKIDPDTVDFAMNAGMFDDNGRPIGLASAGGKRLHDVNLRDGPGNFHMKPNGVFLVDCKGKAVVVRSAKVTNAGCEPRLATQSGPMLVIDGKLHPAFDRDGTSRHIRNGVGVTEGGNALFVISQDPVSFGKLARFFRDSLHTPDALYFDGAVSSLWDPANGRMDSHSPIGPIIVAVKRS